MWAFSARPLSGNGLKLTTEWDLNSFHLTPIPKSIWGGSPQHRCIQSMSTHSADPSDRYGWSVCRYHGRCLQRHFKRFFPLFHCKRACDVDLWYNREEWQNVWNWSVWSKRCLVCVMLLFPLLFYAFQHVSIGFLFSAFRSTNKQNSSLCPWPVERARPAQFDNKTNWGYPCVHE